MDIKVLGVWVMDLFLRDVWSEVLKGIFVWEDAND
jgi:hypothetical protein